MIPDFLHNIRLAQSKSWCCFVSALLAGSAKLRQPTGQREREQRQEATKSNKNISAKVICFALFYACNCHNGPALKKLQTLISYPTWNDMEIGV